jgi:hypothetical protein
MACLGRRRHGKPAVPKSGLTSEAATLMDSVRTVLDLPSRYGSGETVLTDPSKYIDLTYYDEARRG